MAYDPFEVSVAHVGYAALGGFVVLFGMVSLLLRERLYLGEALIAFIFGVVIGPYGANVFNPRGWAGDNPDTVNSITLEFARVVLAIGVFAIGVELPKAYVRRHWQSLFFLMGPVMIWGWLVSAGFIFALIPGLDFLSSLAVGACLTPTDPILAAAVVGGKYADKHVPAHIRHLLAAESGANDGAAFPFLFLALYLILDASTHTAIKDWFLKLWLYQIILGVCIGSTIGFSFRYLMRFSEKHTLIDRHSYVAQYVSLALLTIGITTLLGSDDLLSAFACGAAFAWDGFFNRQTEESVFSSVIDLLFNVAAFVYIGAWMPFNQFNDPDGSTLQVWRLIVIGILVLLFRRLPAMIALYRWIPDIKTFQEAVFSGHFGPIGVGAVFISTLATQVLQESGLAEENEQVNLLMRTIQPICAFMVICSIAVHGLSIPGFSLGRRVHSVSRTWSRHTTATNAHAPQPDWMDHVRRADGGVVINRDPKRIGDLEEGISGAEKDADGRPLEEIEIDGKQSESPTATGSEGDEKQGTPPGAEDPPDGRTIVSEWQEGPHRVIERRAGPGEEVEVEVIRNVDGTDVSSAYRGPEAVAQHLVEKLRNGPKALEQDLELLGKSIEERIKRSPLPGFVRHAGDVVDDEDDEGWASEESNVALPESSTAAARRTRSLKSNKTKGSSNSRRRASFGRKGLMGHIHSPRQAARTPDIVTTAASESSSNSDVQLPAAASSSRPSLSQSVSATDFAYTASSRRPGRRSRVDSLRGDAVASRRGSRDASPARSVRFAEADSPTHQRMGSWSGTATPRVGIIEDSPADVGEAPAKTP
ncbi:Na-H-Exchanger domain-containing protein [Mycena chlorophos]|uniref:Na-H-Exchanger domain-containing protein n=1 Tax=Mycena chlorophos TaxID=658473 RepID=A0A8H6SCT8_MYCCL|nr:Na-H-Exchanger domain-containing protein [Mycena chlorophos]